LRLCLAELAGCGVPGHACWCCSRPGDDRCCARAMGRKGAARQLSDDAGPEAEP